MNKRIFSILLAVVMVFTMIPLTAFATENPLLTLEQLREQNGAITVEAYNIGQGFLVEPTLFVKDGRSTGDITVDFLTNKGVSYSGSTSYFSGFEFDDTTAPQYPEYLEPYLSELENSGDGDGMLAEFDYSMYAGWCYTINDWWASYGAASSYPGQEITDYNTGKPVVLGDVIRWHFTVYGYGSDCGFPSNVMAEYMGGNLFTQEDKSDLIFALAAINDYYGNLDTDDAYESALAVAADPLATADDIATQEAKLKSYIENTFFTSSADPIDVNVTLANKGIVVMANQTVTVTDLDASGDFTVDEVLYAVHETAYNGGAAAGYGSAMGDYGLYITKLWGDESGNYGYWLNDASCWSLADTVTEGDSVVAFVYQNTEVWDSYSKFAQDSYSALAETSATLTLEKAGYDADWQTVFTAHKGATIKVYDADFKELNADAYKVTDNADGTYGVTVDATGIYTVVAYDNTTPIVPAVCTITVTENADIPPANAVEAKIDAIGTVTSDSKTTIEEARGAYDALTDAQKSLVDNYDVLVAAEETLAAINADTEAAEAVKEKINAIGTVTIHSCNKIKAARTAYNALTDTQKQYVDNYSALTAAEDKIAELYVEAANADHKAIYEATGEYINALGTPSVGSVGGEWMVIDLTRAGYACPEGYYQNVVDYVNNKINDKEQLHRAKSTDNSRVILALTAAGYDVTDVDGHNLLMGLTDMTYVKKQGINGPIWALIAFDCYKYDIPENPSASDQVTREKLIAYILEKQLEDGGWALSGTKADPDMTGMAIQSLAPYYNTNAEVKAAVDEALDCLSALQYDNGGFGFIDGTCSESCAQVIVALTALGINPETDARFVKNGVSVVDAMCLFAIENGGFAHIPEGELNDMATEQGQYALASYFRFLEGKTALYDMTDVILVKDKEAAAATEKLISEIGTVTLNSKSAIDAARASYDALTDEQKMLVTSYEVLTNAEAAYAELAENKENKVPENGKTPEDPKNENTTDQTESPQTGDNSNMILWFAIMLTSLFALVFIAFYSKRFSKESK